MEHFLETKFTIPEGLGIGSWGPVHLIWLAFIALFIAAVSISYRRGDEKRRGGLRILICSLTLLDEAAKYLFSIPAGHWVWDFLPLHLCSLSVFLVLAHTLTNDDRVAEALYALSLPSAMAALLFPNWTALPCMNWESIHSFTVHALLVAYPVMLIAGGFRPRFSRLLWTFPFLALAIVVAVIANTALDTNFFFLNGGDEGNPLSFAEDLVGAWYVLLLPIAAALLWSLMYLVPRRLRWF